MANFKVVVLLLSAGLFWAVLSDAAKAQVRRYTPPAGSPLPAELDYFRRDVGVMDPFNTFVAPRRQLRNQLNAMSAREAANFQSAQQEITSIREAVAAPTGVSAGFMNYSHYYSRSPGSRRR